MEEVVSGVIALEEEEVLSADTMSSDDCSGGGSSKRVRDFCRVRVMMLEDASIRGGNCVALMVAQILCWRFRDRRE